MTNEQEKYVFEYSMQFGSVTQLLTITAVISPVSEKVEIVNVHDEDGIELLPGLRRSVLRELEDAAWESYQTNFNDAEVEEDDED